MVIEIHNAELEALLSQRLKAGSFRDVEDLLLQTFRAVPLTAPTRPNATSVYAEGLGLFGSSEEAALLDEVVHIAYEERRRPSGSSSEL